MSKIISVQSNDDALTTFQKAIDDHDFKEKLYLKFAESPSNDELDRLCKPNSHLCINLVVHSEYNGVLYPELTEGDINSGLYFTVVRMLCSGPPILF
jgi:hypothetical protein